MAKSPYNIKLMIMAPEKAEYLASGPKFDTACDSNCPGVSENNVCDASSGMNIPPAYDRITSAIAMAMAPAARPATKDPLVGTVPDLITLG
jgi:hypothetical protein